MCSCVGVQRGHGQPNSTETAGAGLPPQLQLLCMHAARVLMPAAVCPGQEGMLAAWTSVHACAGLRLPAACGRFPWRTPGIATATHIPVVGMLHRPTMRLMLCCSSETPGTGAPARVMQGLGGSDVGVTVRRQKCPPAGGRPAAAYRRVGGCRGARIGFLAPCSTAGRGWIGVSAPRRANGAWAASPGAHTKRVGAAPRTLPSALQPLPPLLDNPAASPGLPQPLLPHRGAGGGFTHLPPAAPTAHGLQGVGAATSWPQRHSQARQGLRGGREGGVRASPVPPGRLRGADRAEPTPGRAPGRRCARWRFTTCRRSGPPTALRAPHADFTFRVPCSCAACCLNSLALYGRLPQLFAHPDNAVIFRGIERCTYRRILWAAGDSLPGDGRQTIEVENESGAHCQPSSCLLYALGNAAQKAASTMPRMDGCRRTAGLPRDVRQPIWPCCWHVPPGWLLVACAAQCPLRDPHVVAGRRAAVSEPYPALHMDCSRFRPLVPRPAPTPHPKPAPRRAGPNLNPLHSGLPPAPCSCAADWQFLFIKGSIRTRMLVHEDPSAGGVLPMPCGGGKVWSQATARLPVVNASLVDAASGKRQH